MKKSVVTTVFDNDIESVWEAVTDNADFSWRSDIDRIEIHDDGDSFTEYSKQGGVVNFRILKFDVCKVYEAEMESPEFSGRFKCGFSTIEDGKTELVLTEEIKIKNIFKRALAFFFMDLQKIQQQYISDLKKRLEEQV